MKLHLFLLPLLLVPLASAVAAPAPAFATSAEDVIQKDDDPKLRERKKLFEDCVGRELPAAWSEYIHVMCDHSGYKWKKKKIESEELAKEVVLFSHALFVEYCELMDVKPVKAFEFRQEILLFEDVKDHAKVGREVLEWTIPEESEDMPMRRGGAPGGYTIHLNSTFAKDGAALRKRLTQNLVSAFLDAQKPISVLITSGNAWLTVGLGMWFEDKHYQTVSASDNSELAEALPAKAKKWRGAIKKLVKKKKLGKFEDLIQLSGNDMDSDAALMAASLVDFLIQKDIKAFRELVLHIKSKTPTRDAVQVVYGWKLDELEDAWSAWVVKKYK